MAKEIPIIEYGVDEETGESFTMVANTKNPAIKSKGYAFSEKEMEVLRTKYFANDEQMIIIAPVIIPEVNMSPRYDWIDIGNGPEFLYHQPIFSEKGIKQMYKKFMKKLSSSYIFNNEHDSTVRPSYFFEIWQKESMTQDKSAMYGLDHPVGTVYMMEQVEDPTYWAEIKKTGAYGFSIQGLLGTTPYGFSDDDMEQLRIAVNKLTPKQLERFLIELL